MRQLSIYILLIFSPTLFALQKVISITRPLKSSIVAQQNIVGLLCRKYGYGYGNGGMPMGAIIGHSIGRASGEEEGYSNGYQAATKLWELEKLQLYRDLLSARKSKTIAEFDQVLMEKTREAAIPRKKDLNDQLAEIERKLNNWFTFESTKKQLQINAAKIKEELGRLEELDDN